MIRPVCVQVILKIHSKQKDLYDIFLQHCTSEVLLQSALE